MIKNDDITVETYAYAPLARIKSRDDVVKAWKYIGKFFCLRRQDPPQGWSSVGGWARAWDSRDVFQPPSPINSVRGGHPQGDLLLLNSDRFRP